MKTILIVGGGAAGLSAGIFAQLNGYRAVICEKGNTAGGCLSCWEREGYHIDNCIHWLIGTNKNTNMYKTWCKVGALDNTEIHYNSRLFTSNLGNESLSLSRDVEKLQNDMLSLSPRDEREIKSFIKAIKTLEGYFGIAGDNHDESITGKKMLTRLPNLLKYLNLSLEDLACRFHHPVIKDFIVSFMPEGFGALGLIFTAANYCGDNAGLPVGGSAVVFENLMKKYLSLGGTIEYGKEAVAVNREGRKVVSVSFADGTEMTADYYIMTLDPSVVFSELTDCPMPSELAKAYKMLKRFSAIQCAFGCDITSLPFEGEQTLFIPKQLRSILPGHHVNLRYEAHEESYSPKGKSLLQSMIYCSEESAASFIEMDKMSREKYLKRKSEIAQTLSELIVKQFPFLEGKMHVIDVWTPATYKKFVGTQIGSFMSFAFPKRRMPKELNCRVDSLDNLVLAGQWLQMPGGLPIAVNSGRNAVAEIAGDERG